LIYGDKHTLISKEHNEEEVELEQSSRTKHKETLFSVNAHFCLTFKIFTVTAVNFVTLWA